MSDGTEYQMSLSGDYPLPHTHAYPPHIHYRCTHLPHLPSPYTPYKVKQMNRVEKARTKANLSTGISADRSSLPVLFAM